MRQIFTSQRLETVEGVARLLEEHGVETYTSNSRSYHGRRRSDFSYSATGRDPQPGVWIVRADQLLPAREILRQARLLESTQTGSFLPSSSAAADEAQTTPRERLVSHIRLAVLATVSVLAVITSVKMFVGG